MNWINSSQILPGMDQQASRVGSALRTGSDASDLLLVLFLLQHLVGVALAPLAPQRFEVYATILVRSSWLPAAELALICAALISRGSLASTQSIGSACNCS